MTKLKASEARIPARVYSRVVRSGERVAIERRDGGRVYLVSERDVRVLEALEDRLLANEAKEVLARLESGEEQAVSLAVARKALAS